MSAHAFAGRTIAISETRELDVFAGLLERRGATVMRCPLIAIHDAPDPKPVLAWIARVVASGARRFDPIDRRGIAMRLRCVRRLSSSCRGCAKLRTAPKPRAHCASWGCAWSSPPRSPQLLASLNCCALAI